MCNIKLASLLLVLFGYSGTIAQNCDPSWIEIPQNGIDEDCDGLDDIYLNLPPNIYMVEGQDFELYYRNCILSKHPHDYVFEVITPVGGLSQSDKWVFTPTASDFGVHAFSLNVKAPDGTLLSSATSTLRISPDTFAPNNGPKKLLLFGHSFYDQGYMPTYIYNLVQQPNNPQVTFYGSKHNWISSNIRYEGHGGQTWRWFNEDPISPITFGADSSIDFPQYYDKEICQGCKPDWVIIFLDVNDFCGYTPLVGATLQEIDDTITSIWNRYADEIIEEIQISAPNCKIAICSAPPPNARESAFIEKFGTGNVLADKWRWQKIVSRLSFLYEQKWGNRENENIYFVPTHLDIDDFLEYPQLDPIHPSPENGNMALPNGYKEMAKTIFSWMKYVLNETAPPTWYRDADADGFGRVDDVLPGYNQPVGFAANYGDCDDNDPNVNPSMVEICGNGKDDNCNNQIDEDWTSPEAECVSGITLDVGNSGLGSISYGDIDAGSSDDCAITNLEISQEDFDCSQVGFHFVVLTATDANGNTADCSAVVEVVDNIAPVLHRAQNGIIDVLLDSNTGSAVIALSDLVTTTDNCLDSYSYSFDNVNFVQEELLFFDCSDASENVLSVYVKGTDLAGNVSSELRIRLLITEDIPPTIICKNHTTTLDSYGGALVDVTQLYEAKSDNCSSAEILGPLNWQLDCSDVGEVEIELIVSDAIGNTSICTSTVSVTEIIKPEIFCQNFSISLSGNGIAVVDAHELIYAMHDNCSIPTLVTPSIYSFSCSDIGVKAIVLTVDDASGNQASCQSTLTIVDDMKPSLVCIDTILSLQNDGSLSISALALLDAFQDNCDIPQLTTPSFYAFTCENQGVNEIILSGKDGSGNSRSCLSTVTIIDTIDTDFDGVINCLDQCPENPMYILPFTVYSDADGDGVGGEFVFGEVCSVPIGTSLLNTDCDDTNNAIYPDAEEVLDGIDNNCNGLIDEGTTHVFSQNEKERVLEIYPNPASSFVSVEFKETFYEIQSMKCLSNTGQEVKNITWNQTSKGATLNTDALPNGIYSLQILSKSNKILYARFLKVDF